MSEAWVRFSVVVPLFNKARYVRESVESVIAQHCTDWEMVVIDDGSTDGSGAIIGQIHDPRIRLFRQSNAGVSAARNAGIERALGEWVTFLDADDWYHPAYLSTLHEMSEEQPAAEALATGFVSEPDDEWAPWDWPLDDHSGHRETIVDLPRRWMLKPPFYMNSLAARRARLERMQPCFPVGESTGEDLDLIFRLAEEVDIVLDGRPLVAYRRDSSNSLSRAATAAPPLLEPYLRRMEQRASRRRTPAEKRRSALWFVNQLRLTNARTALAMGLRGQGVRMLLDARGAVTNHRWWVTLAMAAMMTSAQIARREGRARAARMYAESPPPRAAGGSDRQGGAGRVPGRRA